MNYRDLSLPTLDGLIERLQLRLNAHATAATREWWTKYLRGAASFRGVKMEDVGRLYTPGSRKSNWESISPLGSRRFWS
jgi:hypothetical protein